jgi:hypothetical protein
MKPNSNKAVKISDEAFNQQVTLRESYQIMVKFLEQYVSRGDTSVIDLFTFVTLHPDGGSLDPAMLDDYIKSVGEIINK